ncbi:triacylglycerol lipase [Cupriavidus sp. GA3-3]|uniref:esterase/lipase family protein n=1 Tax=Cupriavidus sp. GA3-3 TaxID=1229514 RepID=UPI001FED973B|nr:hypothetical protein [Cupriavidus sp. GA3-3]
MSEELGKAASSERMATGFPDGDGSMRYGWTMTPSPLTDLVKLVIKPVNVLPVIFVPGIMGSNLKSKVRNVPVWRLNATLGQPFGLLWNNAPRTAGARQVLLHPDKTLVDDAGAVPTFPVGSIGGPTGYKARGWGEVGETSYQAFLLWLERTLNHPGKAYDKSWKETLNPILADQSRPWGAHRPFAPCTASEIEKVANWFYPVYACGYNWLEDNALSARRLKSRIERIIRQHQQGFGRCKQVLLVTHSMGGLVARACSQLEGMAEKIAGIVHGVMPAIGAPVAYRRCKVGMRDEDYAASLVIGQTGLEVTAVFAQAPGALELLPTQQYDSSWLRVKDLAGNDLLPPHPDPYDGIYAVRDRWWGLIKEEWLAPEGGEALGWKDAVQYISRAKDFHVSIADKYHAFTYGFHAADPKQKSFEHVIWQLKKGISPEGEAQLPNPSDVMQISPQQVRMDGTNPEYVGGENVVQVVRSGMGPSVVQYDTSHYELHASRQDGGGDGTVPVSSGRAPATAANVRQWFALKGFAHEPAYKNEMAQFVTLYSIVKLTAQARTPPGNLIWPPN